MEKEKTFHVIKLHFPVNKNVLHFCSLPLAVARVTCDNERRGNALKHFQIVIHYA